MGIFLTRVCQDASFITLHHFKLYIFGSFVANGPLLTFGNILQIIHT